MLSKKNKTKTNKKVKPTVKNVLGNPFENFWPCLDLKESELMNDVLRTNLSRLVPEKCKIKWSALKDIEKSKRKAFLKKQQCDAEPNSIDLDLKKELIFGVNQVAKHLAYGNIAALIVATEVKPRALVSHLVTSCVSKQIPVLAVNGLIDNLRTVTGIPAMTMALKKSYANHVKVTTIVNHISNLYKKYKPRVQKSDEEDSKKRKLEKIMYDNTNTNDLVENKQIEKLTINLLTKPSTRERAFNPPESTETPTPLPWHAMKKENPLDYISFSDSPSTYIPLKVKRVKSQPDRINIKKKKKIK